jgi:hypothetical protein
MTFVRAHVNANFTDSQVQAIGIEASPPALNEAAE